MNKYTAFFAAYNTSKSRGNPLTKEEVVASYTNGRTSSLKELSHIELAEIVRQLNSSAPPPQIASTKEDKMRKSIIAIFRDMGLSVDDAKPWAEKQGVKGIKKHFNKYSAAELFVLIRLAEKIRSEQAQILRSSMAKALKN
jgi:hypothetical protein